VKTSITGLSIAATPLLVLLLGCERNEPVAPTSLETPAVTAAKASAPKKLSIKLCAPSRGGFTLTSTNPYFPMDVGRQLVLTGEEGGDSITLQVTVLDRTRTIAGVTTRVVEEREWANGDLSEVTWNYHVQAPDGTNCYYGEDVDIYEDGGISHEGAWCAGAGDNQAGIFMPADPRPGTKYQNEVAPGVAEDEAKIVGVGPVEVPFGEFRETIRIREFDPLTAEKDYKIHAAGVGIIVDGPLRLVDINHTAGVPEQPTLTRQACGA
jgi:hypothetical protein